MPVPARFELVDYGDLTGRATDTGEEHFLGVLRAAPHEGFYTSSTFQVLSEQSYRGYRALHVREISAERGEGGLGLIVDPSETQMVAAIGGIAQFIRILADGCSRNVLS